MSDVAIRNTPAPRDAIDHFGLGHDFLARAVTAALLRNLVLYVHAGRAGFYKGAHRARDLERATPASVGINEQWQVAHVRNAADVDQHVFHRGNTEVRHAE